MIAAVVTNRSSSNSNIVVLGKRLGEEQKVEEIRNPMVVLEEEKSLLQPNVVNNNNSNNVVINAVTSSSSTTHDDYEEQEHNNQKQQQQQQYHRQQQHGYQKQQQQQQQRHDRELQSANSQFFIDLSISHLYLRWPDLEMYIECFSKYTTVYVQSNGNGGSVSNKVIPINNIQIGDKVLTSSGKYETIYTIGHTNPSKVTQFIQIYTTPDITSSSSGDNKKEEDQQQPLEVTRNHMIYVADNEHPIPAHNIQIGDYVQTMKGPRKVIQLHTVMRKGIYNPLTMDGTIVVNHNGIIASTYSALFSDNEYIVLSSLSENNYMMNNIISHQDFFDTLLQPYKYFCTHISMQLCKGIPKLMTESTSNNQQENIPMILQIAYNLYAKYWVVALQHQEEGENNNNANLFLLLFVTLIYVPLRVLLTYPYYNVFTFMMLMVVIMKNNNDNTGWFTKQRRNEHKNIQGGCVKRKE